MGDISSPSFYFKVISNQLDGTKIKLLREVALYKVFFISYVYIIDNPMDIALYCTKWLKYEIEVGLDYGDIRLNYRWRTWKCTMVFPADRKLSSQNIVKGNTPLKESSREVPLIKIGQWVTIFQQTQISNGFTY